VVQEDALELVTETLISRLDSVDPLYNDDADHIFSEDDIRALSAIDGVEQQLLTIALDGAQPLERRFAAVEALFQGGWTGWRSGPDGPAIAAVFAEAIRADKIHNRWGVPGHFVGRSSADLLSIEHGVQEALEPLLDDQQPLSIDGSEAATLSDTAGYRVSDLAGYLLATKRGESWTDDVDPAVRDAGIERLRG
jgi:hypothetical protein